MLYAQNVGSVSFNWENVTVAYNKKGASIGKRPYFSNASLNARQNFMPESFFKFLISQSDNFSQLYLSGEIWQACTRQESQALTEANFKETQPNIIFNCLNERTQRYLIVKIIPLRYANGKYEKLISANINATSNKNLNKLRSKAFTVENSVLRQGKWVKIAISKSGIHKISYNTLRNMGFSSPEKVRVFSDDFGMLPFMNSSINPDDLTEKKILNYSDYIFFYASGPDVWNFDSEKNMYVPKNHLYCRTAYCFLTDFDTGFAKAITDSENATSASMVVTSGDFYANHEEDLINLLMSGRQWFGENFYYTVNKTISVEMPNAPESKSAKIDIRTVARSTTSSSFGISIGNTNKTVSHTAATDEPYADVREMIFEYIPENSTTQNINITFNKSTASAEGYLDYIIINTSSGLNYSNNQLIFRNKETVNMSCEYQISGADNNCMIWDISNAAECKNIKYTLNGTTAVFGCKSDTIAEFAVFKPADAIEISTYETIENQNLHGLSTPEYLIIAPREFISAAKELAEYRSTEMTSAAVATDKIYNEFSCGATDVSALRNFIRYLYKKNNVLKYVLLLGDGSVDNITVSANNTNFIPTYQSYNSLDDNSENSFVSDDYFSLLDDNEGEYTGLPDIGVGRLSVKSASEAMMVVNKIKTYDSSISGGDRRKTALFIADDENSHIHETQSDYLAEYTEDSTAGIFNVEKIYLDAYKQENSAAGNTYPEAQQSIINSLNKGALYVNYTGHAGMNYFAHEKVLTNNDIDGLTNINTLPLIITATCEAGRFDYYSRDDDANSDSPAEHFILSSKGGAAALISPGREVYMAPNFTFNKYLTKYLFYKQINNLPVRTGDIFRISKSMTGDYNMLSYALAGDPAMTLRLPDNAIEITEINNKPINEFNDTLKALSKVKIKCKTSDNSFSGTAYTTVFDKKNNLSTLNNDNEGVFEYTSYNSVIYRGSSTVKNGSFEFVFIVPKDINYKVDTGKISLFAINESTSLTGVNKNIKIGSVSNDAPQDIQGPEIKLYLNDYSFVDGGRCDNSPLLLARLSDSSGINTTGNSIGHDITLICDDNTSSAINLNDNYVADKDSYTGGTLEYRLQNLSTGLHKIKLKARDTYNNSGEAELSFYVTSDEGLKIFHLVNYPNPFTDKTAFYFEHNAPGQNIEYEIGVYSASGKLVKTLTGNSFSTSYNSVPINWNGRDNFGDRIAKGVYFYKLSIKNSAGQRASKYEKLLYLK